MSLTFGYDLKDGDKFIEASNQLTSELRPLLIPARGAVVNLLPFCTDLDLDFACL